MPSDSREKQIQQERGWEGHVQFTNFIWSAEAVAMAPGVSVSRGEQMPPQPCYRLYIRTAGLNEGMRLFCRMTRRPVTAELRRDGRCVVFLAVPDTQ